MEIKITTSQFWNIYRKGEQNTLSLINIDLLLVQIQPCSSIEQFSFFPLIDSENTMTIVDSEISDDSDTENLLIKLN